MEKIGKYDIVREIGRGATSTVYLCKDPFAKRQRPIPVGVSVLKDVFIDGKMPAITKEAHG